MKRRLFSATLLASSLALGTAAQAQTKWDLSAAYPATNFHTENLTQFANDVDKATGGKLKITVHANASLFKAPEIKRAVQGGQAQIGEILLANFANESPIYALDGVPFLATGYEDSRKLYEASKGAMDKLLAPQGMKLLYAVAWPPQGIYTKRTLNSAADMKGLKWRAYSPATARIAEIVGADGDLTRFPLVLRLLPLRGQRLLEARDVDEIAALTSHEFGQVDREAKRVVQAERVFTGQRAAHVR